MNWNTTNYLKEMSWKRFVERKKESNLLLIPTGAFEVYGPHLPLGTDTLVSNKIAELLAERINSIIGPTLEVGDSSILDEFPGTITIQPESFKSYLKDTIDSLVKWGFKDFLFINTHVSNVPVIGQLAYELQRKEGYRTAQIDYWRFLKTLDEGIIESGDLAHAHASEAGTSVMMYLYPDLCNMSSVINDPPKIINHYPDILQYQILTNITDSGTIGDATLGTVEKGERLVKRSLDRICDYLKQSWDYDEKN